MTAPILFWIGNVLAFLILWRGFRSVSLKKYPYFYAYVASILSSLVLPIVYLAAPSSYDRWYWPIQFATLVFGCGVILEIFDHVLLPYPGAERFAKLAALVAFGAVFCPAIIYAIVRWEPLSSTTGIDLERNVRALQAVLLFALLAVIYRYGIPIGKNVLGMIVGYGGYIAVSLVSRAVEAYAGTWLRLVWIYVQPLTFELSLTIWLVALWSYHPDPVPDPSIQLDADYELLVSRTRRALDATRSYLERTARF